LDESQSRGKIIVLKKRKVKNLARGIPRQVKIQSELQLDDVLPTLQSKVAEEAGLTIPPPQP
jgi:hypothetical protein